MNIPMVVLSSAGYLIYFYSPNSTRHHNAWRRATMKVWGMEACYNRGTGYGGVLRQGWGKEACCDGSMG